MNSWAQEMPVDHPNTLHNPRQEVLARHDMDGRHQNGVDGRNDKLPHCRVQVTRLPFALPPLSPLLSPFCFLPFSPSPVSEVYFNSFASEAP